MHPAPQNDIISSTAKLRVLIADDETAGRHRLRGLLALHQDVEIVGECVDGPSTLESIREARPDVVMLDIEMPGLDGVALASELPLENRPVLIFVTAYEQHAVNAFSVQATDYLLKPFTGARLAQALTRARASVQTHGNSPSKKTPLQRLVVPQGERMAVVQVNEIDWIESGGNYAIIHVGRTTHILRETMTALESRLPAGHFLRISRTALVNLDRVRELRSDENSDHVMSLADGTKLVITRGIREVQKRLEAG
jgi:two-component system LytT family response regulator